MSWEKLLVEQSRAPHLHHGEAVSRLGTSTCVNVNIPELCVPTSGVGSFQKVKILNV